MIASAASHLPGIITGAIVFVAALWLWPRHSPPSATHEVGKRSSALDKSTNVGPPIQTAPPISSPQSSLKCRSHFKDRPSYANGRTNIDRQNLRAALRDISMLLTDEISPRQLKMHRLTDEIFTALRDSNGMTNIDTKIDSLNETVTKFTVIRNMLNDRFAHGKMYADEIWDVLGDNEPLGTEVIYISQYIPVLRARPTGAALIGLLAPLSEQIRKANFATGNWVGESLNDSPSA